MTAGILPIRSPPDDGLDFTLQKSALISNLIPLAQTRLSLKIAGY